MAKRKTATAQTPPRKPPQRVSPKGSTPEIGAKRSPAIRAVPANVPQLWDYVTREGKDGVYQITKISPDGLTCTLTSMKGGYHTNLEHPRILIATLTCVAGPNG